MMERVSKVDVDICSNQCGTVLNLRENNVGCLKIIFRVDSDGPVARLISALTKAEKKKKRDTRSHALNGADQILKVEIGLSTSNGALPFD